MRSKDVAALAGVTVRTLRHYHQVGVLPEPGRGTNGYRDYELAHVARLLRIRTLAELGVPLERMPPLLDDPTHAAGEEVLAELEVQLEERIARLQSQLRRVGEIRASRTRPDLAPGLAELLDAVGSAHGSVIAGIEHDASVLLARLYEADDASGDLLELAAALGDVRRDASYADLAATYETLPPDAPEEQVRELADAFVTAFGADLTRLIDGTMGGRLRRLRAEEVPAVEVDPRLNPAQGEVLRLVGERL